MSARENRRTTAQRKADLAAKLKAGKKTRGSTVTRTKTIVSEEDVQKRQQEIQAFEAEEQRRSQLQEQRRQDIELFDIGFQEAQQRRSGEQAQFDIDLGEAREQRQQEQQAFDIDFGQARQTRQGEILAFEQRLEAGAGPSPEQLFFDERTQPLRDEISQLSELEQLQTDFIAANHTPARGKSPCGNKQNPFKACPRGGLILPKGVQWSHDPYTGDFVPVGFSSRASGKVRGIYGAAVAQNKARIDKFNADRQVELDRLQAIKIQKAEKEQDLSVFGERPADQEFDPASLGPRPEELTLEEFTRERGARPGELTLEEFGMRPEDLGIEDFGERPGELMFDPLGDRPEELTPQQMLFEDIIPGNVRPFQERREVTRAGLTERRITKRKPGRKTRKVASQRRGGQSSGFREPFSVNLDDIGLF